MHNILIFSNNAISNSESNGRIYSYLVDKYLPDHISNFYVRGNSDIDGVKYLFVSPKKALFSKLTFGFKKISFYMERVSNSQNGCSNKSKKVFYHLLRNFSYSRNYSILKALSLFIKENNIDTIFLWGSNVPFLYQYAFKIAKKHKLDLITYTGEDYPLKDYNYISFRKSILFPCFQRKLFKFAKAVYSISRKNYFTNDEIKEFYKKTFELKHAQTEYLKSTLTEISHKPNTNFFDVLYGGNLYNDRVNSIIEISQYLSKYSNVRIIIYGNGEQKQIQKLNECKNIFYKGVVPYNELLSKFSKANLLLHVEGFSEFYKKDCKYAFSTKISDYFLSRIPFFVYGPLEISGVKYLLKLIPNFVAINKDELYKLDSIICGKTIFKFDFDTVNKDFSINSKIDIFD